MNEMKLWVIDSHCFSVYVGKLYGPLSIAAQLSYSQMHEKCPGQSLGSLGGSAGLVDALLSNLNAHKAAGPDGISALKSLKRNAQFNCSDS